MNPAVEDAVCRALLAATRDPPGREICGFLVEHASAQTFRRAPNLGGPGEFWIDPAVLDGILGDIGRARSLVTAFVHSHASCLQLSGADEAAMRSSPWPWLVVVRRGQELAGRWFRADPDGIRSEAMVVAG